MAVFVKGGWKVMAYNKAHQRNEQKHQQKEWRTEIKINL